MAAGAVAGAHGVQLAQVEAVVALSVNGGLAAYGFSAGDLQAIHRDNALRLLPRLKS